MNCTCPHGAGKWGVLKGVRSQIQRAAGGAAGLMLQSLFCSNMEGFGSKNILSNLQKTVKAAIWLMVSPSNALVVPLGHI